MRKQENYVGWFSGLIEGDVLNLPTYPVTHLWQEGYEFDEANIFEGAFYPCIIAAPYQGALKVQFKEILVLLLYIL